MSIRKVLLGVAAVAVVTVGLKRLLKGRELPFSHGRPDDGPTRDGNADDSRQPEPETVSS